MATSVCSVCKSPTFEMVEATPTRSHFTILFVQCANCGAVVGTMTLQDAGVLADSIQHQVAEVKQKIGSIDDQLERMRRYWGIQ